MDIALTWIKIIAVLIGAAMLGSWFLSDLRAARIARKPWYTPYVGIPGLLILLFVLGLPIVKWILQR